MTEHEARIGMKVRFIPQPMRRCDPDFYVIAALYRRQIGDPPRACLRKVGSRRRLPVKLAEVADIFEVQPLVQSV